MRSSEFKARLHARNPGLGQRHDTGGLAAHRPSVVLAYSAAVEHFISWRHRAALAWK